MEMHRSGGIVDGIVPRRGFLTRLAGAIVGGGVVAGSAGTLYGETPREGRLRLADPWLDRLKGERGQIFDATTISGGKVLQQARNFLDAYRDAYGVSSEQLDVVVGAHGGALPLVFQDAAWDRFAFGERSDVNDYRTRAPARRNIFARAETGSPIPADATIEALQERGVIFILCNNSLRRITGTLAQAGFGTAEEVRAELLAGLLPGVEVVPAMVVAMNLAQERGLSYVYSG